MLSRSFIERVILMIIGAYITYAVSTQLMKDALMNSDEQIKYNGQLDLNHHEKIVHNYVITHEDLNTSFDDIKGLTKAKEMLQKLIIKPLNSNKTKLNPPNGVILYGPPGTGKTMLVKALCHEMKINFISFEQNFIEQKMFGESAKMIKALFTLAKKIKPCVIFIDELDGIFSERSSFDQSFVNNIKTQMLMHLDGFIEKDTSIILIGATNRLSSIDPALKRRMRTHIEIPLPTDLEREDIFKCYLSNKEDIDYNLLALNTFGYSGSDIHEACKIAAYTYDEITTESLIDTIENYL